MAQAAEPETFDGEIAFVKELGTFLSEKYVSLVLLNVACDSFNVSVTENLKLYMRNEYSPDFKLAFNGIINRHNGIFPLYEIRSMDFIPVRSEIDIENYVQSLANVSLPPMVNNDSLADKLCSFLYETEKSFLRTFYEFFDFAISRSDNGVVKLNEINNFVDVNLIHQVFGLRGSYKFVVNHPEIFIFKKIENESYVSLNPDADINGYIETLRVPKIKLHRNPMNVTLDNVKSAPLSELEKEAILFVDKQISNFSGIDRILTVKTFSKKVAPIMPSHIINELKFLYGPQPYRKFVTKHKTVFQPLNKRTGHKIESFRLANTVIIQEYLRNATDKVTESNLEQFKNRRMNDVEKAVRIEIETLNFIRALIVAETDITVDKLRKEVIEGGKTKNSVKNCLSKAKIDDFLFKHARVFPMVFGQGNKMVFEAVSDQIFEEYANHVKKSITDKMVAEIELQAQRDRRVGAESREEPGSFSNQTDYHPVSDDEDCLDMIAKFDAS